MSEVSREELYAAIAGLTTTVTNGFAGVNTRLDTLNGKVYTHEAAIAATAAVLEERKEQARDGHARYAAWSGVLTALGGLLWQFISKRP